MIPISAILPLSIFFTLSFYRLSHSSLSQLSEQPEPRLWHWDVSGLGLEHSSESPRRALRIREREGYKSLSNSTSINMFQIKNRWSCKKVSSTELRQQLWYNTEVLPFFTYSALNCSFVNIAYLFLFNNMTDRGAQRLAPACFVQHPTFLSDRFQLLCFCVSKRVFVKNVEMAGTSSSGTSGNIPDTLLYTLHFLEDFARGYEEPGL